jgi:hypothetical protein
MRLILERYQTFDGKRQSSNPPVHDNAAYQIGKPINW